MAVAFPCLGDFLGSARKFDTYNSGRLAMPRVRIQRAYQRSVDVPCAPARAPSGVWNDPRTGVGEEQTEAKTEPSSEGCPQKRTANTEALVEPRESVDDSNKVPQEVPNSIDDSVKITQSSPCSVPSKSYYQNAGSAKGESAGHSSNSACHHVRFAMGDPCGLSAHPCALWWRQRRIGR